MTRRDEHPPEGPHSIDDTTGLPEDLETALYDLYFDAPAEEREGRFENLLASHPDHADALRRAQQALTRSEHMLGHLRTELDDAAAASQYIGPFEILRVLGEGGFGTVYLARQHEPVQRQVALKVLRQGHADERSTRRFEAERQLLARLQHENIAQVYDAGTTDEQQHYFAMEFVDGKPITTWCEQAGADMQARLRLFLRVCAAIHHAHQREVVHRDLKPSNVLVHDQDGQPVPKVIDFGIAKLLAAQTPNPSDNAVEPTLVGAQVGTPGYMSPEQAAGEWIDTRTDVYSLGVLLCELLTGEQPLPREKLRSSSFVAMAKMLAEEPPRRPSSIVGRRDRALFEQLREDLDWIVLRAVAPQRDDRYTSVAALAEDVERYLRCQPVLARQNATGYVVRKFARRHRVGVALAAVAAVALIATLFGLTWGFRAVDNARAEAERGRDLAETRGAAARMAVAHHALDSGDAVTTREYLPSVPPERRHWGWRHLASQVDHSETILAVENVCDELLWLDEARVLAFPLQGDITCWNVDTAEPEYTFEGWQDKFCAVAFAREHDLALVAGHGDVSWWKMLPGKRTRTLISLWNVRSGKRVRTVHQVAEETLAMAWSDDRTLAVIGSKGGWLDIVPIRLSGRRNSSQRDGASPAPEDSNPATADASPATGAITAADAVPRKLRYRFNNSVTAIAFCGNNELLLGFERGEVRRVEVTTGKTLAVMRGHTDAIDHLLFDEAGDRVYTASVDATVRAWDLQTAAPRAKRTVGFRVRRLALTAKRDLLFACGGWTDCGVLAWHTDTFELAGRYHGHRAGVRSLALSPEQRRVATVSRDETLRTWPIEPPRSSRILDAGRDARVLSASRDGSRFAAAAIDGRITVWNAHTLKPELQLKTRKPWTGSALHEDNVYVVSGLRYRDNNIIRAMRIADGAVLYEGTAKNHEIQQLLVVAETDRLFGCYGKHLLVWRLSDLVLLHEHELQTKASRIAWDARARRPLLGDHNGGLHQLNATDGTIESSHMRFEIPELSGANASRADLLVVGAGRSLIFDRLGAAPRTVTVLNGCGAISPNTRRVVTGGADHKVRLWDPDTGDQLLVLGGMPYNVAGVHFVDGGRRVIALAHRWTAQCSVHVWTAPDDVELGR
tara:strand:+ start:65163 stop:68555 length:3393 start_codon:yes stop_codon:yes gene_type:complete